MSEYRIDMTGLSADLDIYYVGSDNTFLQSSVGRSTNAKDNDERILFTPKEDTAYFILHNYDFKMSDFKLLLTRSQAYVDEVKALSPIRLDGEVAYSGQVGTRSSLYELGGLTAGSTYRISIEGLQVDADLFVFSDPLFREELGRSSKSYTEEDFVTVSTSSDVLYAEVRGRHRSSGTPFTLTVEERDRLQDQGSAEAPVEIPVGEEVASEVGEGRSYYFFASTPGAAPIPSSCCRRRWTPICTFTATPRFAHRSGDVRQPQGRGRGPVGNRRRRHRLLLGRWPSHQGFWSQFRSARH